MREIIEYLELIKNSIAIKDDKLLAKQVDRIKQLDINNDIVHIVTLIDRNKYNLGSILIDKIILDEREIQTLKSEQKRLDNILHLLNKEKNELLQKIDKFNTTYYKELGSLLLEILKIKLSIVKIQINNSTDDDIESLNRLQSEANDDYKQFTYLLREEESKQPQVLTKIDHIILKDTYTQVMKLCHPDMIALHLRNSVEEIFDELNSAYINNDLSKVKEIKERVTSSKNNIKYRRITKEELQESINTLKIKIGKKKVEIAYLYHNETYQRIQKEGIRGDYFDRTKELLILELESLKEKLEIQIDREYIWMQTLWNWAEKENITTFPKDKKRLLNITSLNISHKNLSEIPQEIGMLTTLSILDVSDNQLQDIPKSIMKLKNLIYLNMSNNNIEQLSKNIGKLVRLEVLDLDNNRLTKLPSSISNLINLRQLKLSNNRLTKLPDSISNLENLRGLFLKGNNLRS
jgi:hypothetical protein